MSTMIDDDDDFEYDDGDINEYDAYEEVICPRCHGLGEDKDGADCTACQGYGSYLRAY